jgi:hypothetical protein
MKVQGFSGEVRAVSGAPRPLNLSSHYLWQRAVAKCKVDSHNNGNSQSTLFWSVKHHEPEERIRRTATGRNHNHPDLETVCRSRGNGQRRR